MELTCARCDRPVRVSAAEYEVFERMHYVCFHYEFEHDGTDPDEECRAWGCPSASLGGGRSRVIETARVLSVEAESGARWENAELHQYLKAFSAWLAEADGYYANTKRRPPRNGWEMVNDALRGATIYE